MYQVKFSVLVLTSTTKNIIYFIPPCSNCEKTKSRLIVLKKILVKSLYTKFSYTLSPDVQDLSKFIDSSPRRTCTDFVGGFWEGKKIKN